MGAAAGFLNGAGEVLRQASVALGGRTVTLYEASETGDLVPRASSAAHPGYHETKIDLDLTLRRWGHVIPPGSRWVAARLADEGPWVIAPLRSRPPAPPPGGKERRSPQRLTMELAGLCLGLIDRRGTTEPGSPTSATDPLRDLLTMPSVIVHEANNPLAAARAGLQLAAETVERLANLDPAERHDLLVQLGEVEEAVDRTIDFLRAVADRARGSHTGPERFDVVGVVRSAVALESLLLRRRGMSVELAGAVEQVYIEGDRNLVYELVSNLVRNAADATTGKPDPITVGLERDAEAVRVVVRDRGAGIPQHLLQRVFEPGFTTKTEGEGGTGLAVVRNIVAGFGGSVRLESVEGRGTTVVVQLPAPPQRSSAEPLQG